MISLIIGPKGTGKTKVLIDTVNKVALAAAGDVVCIEKNMKLTYDVSHKVRLVNVDTYNINGFDMFYGFFAGILAGNYDITDIFVDGTLRIGERDLDAFGELLAKIEKLVEEGGTNVYFTVSCDEDQLPASVKKYL